MLISEFYHDKNIFITGGSGFVGKVLIEKLLRSCPHVGRIYVLMRPKKGKGINDRWREITECALFDKLRQDSPEALQKVHAIAGDSRELGLGVVPEDLQLLHDVHIIFHAAASVRFDDDLRDAVIMNTRGTHELVKLAETMPHLVAFIHVSTTYCYPHHNVIEEKVYKPLGDWRTTIKMAETNNVELLNILFAKYSDDQPNTYTYTKSLAEQIIDEYKDRIPLVIFRPSIVISSIEDPIKGWVDNFNGPVGMLVACGIGIMRTNYGCPDIINDFVPVDLVVRSLILAAFKKGNGENNGNNDLPVYNCATSNLCPITVSEVIDMGKRQIRKNPFDKTLWVPGGGITRCYIWNLLKVLTLHVGMALLVDLILFSIGNKPFLLRLQRRIFATNVALHYFLTKSWDFKNENTLSLDAAIEEESEVAGYYYYICFSGCEMTAMRWNNYYRHLTGALENLRTNCDFVDVSLCCEGRTLKAHKVVLSSCSKYFKEILKENPHPHPVLIFNYIHFEDLKIIVEFMYKGEVNVRQESLGSFLRTAKMLGIEGLAEKWLPPTYFPGFEGTKKHPSNTSRKLPRSAEHDGLRFSEMPAPRSVTTKTASKQDDLEASTNSSARAQENLIVTEVHATLRKSADKTESVAKTPLHSNAADEPDSESHNDRECSPDYDLLNDTEVEEKYYPSDADNSESNMEMDDTNQDLEYTPQEKRIRDSPSESPFGCSSSLRSVDKFKSNILFQDYFQIVAETDSFINCRGQRGGIVARCHFCNREIRGSLVITSNFVRHLKKLHYREFEHYQSAKISVKNSDQGKFERLLTNFVQKNNLPSYVVENESFRELMSFSNAKLNIPNSDTLLK